MTTKDIEILQRGLEEFRVPRGLHDGLIRYMIHHILTGSFLRAVLDNDLKTALRLADTNNRLHLDTIIGFLEHWAPAESWGSPERVTEWLKRRKIVGRTNDTK